jgi:hypothetical protein
MSIVNKLLQRASRIGTKQFVIAGVFTLALAGAVGLGLHTRNQTSAAVIRDCDKNAINNQPQNGGCGAENAAELVKDIQGNKPADLSMIYDHFGLTPGKYDNFIKNAKQGTVFRDGHIEVEGQTVMTDAWTMGRAKFTDQREAYHIKNNVYHTSKTSVAFGSHTSSLPVMVLFADDGTVDVAVINACGNPITKGNKVTPKAVCNTLVDTPDATNPNKHTFTAKATFSGNATLSRVVYHFSDTNTTITTNSLTQPVDHTFAKAGTVTVTVYAKVPGGKEIKASGDCVKQIKYTPPMAVCTALVAVALDDRKQKFRFTIKTATDKNTTVKNADFTVDGTNTTTGVTAKDAQGNIYKEYEFTDDKEHTIKVVVRFNTIEGEKTDANCQAKVTSKKTPMCTVPGFEHLPPNDARCGYCKPGIPKGDARCEDKPEVKGESTTLPNTGAGSMIGLAAGSGILGTLGHRLYVKRRAVRQARQNRA